MGGLLKFLPFLVFVFVAVSVIRNAAKLVRRSGEQSPANPREPDGFDPAMAERTRRIQEEIRRKIAERRGVTLPTQPPVMESMTGSAYASVEPPEEPALTATNAAVLERQQRLADQMRALELARVAEQRRAAQIAAGVKTESLSERGMLSGARDSLLEDLGDPSSLRRAFVLREVLGTPVGLR